MFKYIVLTLLAVCACYYLWPKQTVKTVGKITSTTEASVKAGYKEATK